MYLQDGVNTLICTYDRIFYWDVISVSVHWYSSRPRARRQPGFALGLAKGSSLSIAGFRPLLALGFQKPQLLKAERMASLKVQTADMTRRKVRSSPGLEIFRRLKLWWNRSRCCREVAGPEGISV